MTAAAVSGAAGLERLRRRVAADPLVVAAVGPPALATVRSAVARAVRDEGVLLPPDQLAALVREVADTLAGLGPVAALLRDPGVTDVMVNGPEEVWVERDGRLEPTAVRYPDAGALHAAVLRVVTPLGLRLDRAHAPPSTRACPTAAGCTRCCRRWRPPARWSRFASSPRCPTGGTSSSPPGAVPPPAAALLRGAVADRRAVVCCGRTGTGKTTLLDLLLAEVGDDERVVVIEDAPELRPRCARTSSGWRAARPTPRGRAR